MIQGKDLMKGNVVEYNGYYAVVHSVFGPYPNPDERFNNKECVDLIIGGMATVTVDEISPVILTEEILLKCGFEKIVKRYKSERYILGDFEIEKQGSFFAYVVWNEDYPALTQFFGHHQCLHELQNLYKVIKKQELEIKL